MTRILIGFAAFAGFGVICLLADAIKEATRAFSKPEPKVPERPSFRR